MASGRMIRREAVRVKEVSKHAKKRDELRKRLKDPAVSIEEKFEIHGLMKKLGRDSNPVRISRRCVITGRARGVYRFAGLCRNELRRRANLGELPGVVKSSW